MDKALGHKSLGHELRSMVEALGYKSPGPELASGCVTEVNGYGTGPQITGT